MFIKIFLVVLLLTVIFNLFYALIQMIKHDEEVSQMSKYLGRRLLFSLLIIFFLVVALTMGFITPHATPH